MTDRAGASEAEAHAEEAGLRHASDDEPGIRRVTRGRGFSYHHLGGEKVSVADRARIEALAVPPAWADVWIAPDARAHLQATGRDGKGRKQYRYHDRWRKVRDASRFEELAAFGWALDDLRPALDERLRRRGTVKETIVAAVVRLLDTTLIRVGNDAYARENDTFGLTTLRGRHVEVSGSEVEFDFVAKSGVRRQMSLADPALARVVRRCHQLGGRRLFAFTDEDGTLAWVTSQDVNDLLRTQVGPGTTAKDFRTWGATRLAAATLLDVAPDDTLVCADADPSTSADPVIRALDAAAGVLGNTRAVCRASYVHPRVLEAHATGELAEALERHRAGQNLDRVERTVLDVLES